VVIDGCEAIAVSVLHQVYIPKVIAHPLLITG